jgi:hypothetical protein
MEGGPTVEDAVLDSVISVTSIAAMEALTGVEDYQVSLSGIRSGVFSFNSNDLSEKVDLDPKQGLYIAPSSDTTGINGAWVRVRNTSEGLQSIWFKTAADTSESQSINSAISLALLSKELIVKMPSGVLYVDETIQINRNISLVGSGTMRPETGTEVVGTVLRQAFNGSILVTDDGYNVHLTDFSIQGQPGSYATGWGIYCLKTNYLFNINNVTVAEMPSGGLYAIDLYKATFTNLVIWGCKGWGMHLDGYANNVLVTGGQVSQCGIDNVAGGVRLTLEEVTSSANPGDNQIPAFIGVTIEQSKAQGVFQASGKSKFESCYIEFSNKHGILISGGHVSSSHNWFFENGLGDIRSTALQAYPGFLSIGDLFAGCPSDCVRVENPAYSEANRVLGIVRDPVFSGVINNKYVNVEGLQIQELGTSSDPSLNFSQVPSYAEGGFSATVQSVSHDTTGRMFKAFHDSMRMNFLLSVTYSDAAPTTGEYSYGKIVLNTVIAPGQPLGWVCSIGGSPGTWLKFGDLAAP